MHMKQLDIFVFAKVVSLGRVVDVDVDVMMSGLVPFLLCPLLQGPCVGPLRSETNFLRRTPSTWRTGTSTSISPGSRQPCWQSSCHSFKHALARVPSGVTWGS